MFNLVRCEVEMGVVLKLVRCEVEMNCVEFGEVCSGSCVVFCFFVLCCVV